MAHFSTSTFRITGSGAANHVLFTLENTHATTLVYIRRLNAIVDGTAALTAVMPILRCSRTTGSPTGGYILSKSQFDTSNSSSANVIPRGANALDNGPPLTITAAQSQSLWQTYNMRLHTNNYGQVQSLDNDCMPIIVENQNFVLRQNQSIMLNATSSAAGSNPITTHYIVNCVWEEV